MQKLNPYRLDGFRYSRKQRLVRFILWPVIELLNYLGYENVDYYSVHGDCARLTLGIKVSTMNAVFNVVSGRISIGDNTLIGHNCMFLTGRHDFINGARAGLSGGIETPTEGFDIIIGQGCFLASGVIVIGPVRIGDNTLVGAGSIVIKDLPSGWFCAGIPAKPVREL